jgi:hypothetical protein
MIKLAPAGNTRLQTSAASSDPVMNERCLQIIRSMSNREVLALHSDILEFEKTSAVGDTLQAALSRVTCLSEAEWAGGRH